MKLQLFIVLGVSVGALGFGCDATKVAEQCVGADLIGQCPVGSNPVLGASAESACGGSFDNNIVTEGAAATGQCGSNGSCEFLCQFAVPCSCGVATLTKEQIVCSECADQSCGDGRCEGTERAACAPGQEGCFECVEDCAGPTCGDGDCTGDENPTTCPQDCASACTPNATVCIGTRVSKCAADGRSSVDLDCATVGQICQAGNCVAAGVCGNGVCDGAETPASCAQDCSTLCQPSSRSCEGDKLIVCAADGKSKTETDCATTSQICANGQCRAADVCGNGVCEAGESATCAEDCAAVCGNKVCENNEATTCPADCVVCGDDVCGAGEIDSCPQDCGICVPREKECIAKTLRVCNANGTVYDDIDCNALGLTCGGGDCVEANVCGNRLCEAGETTLSCAQDCGVACGDGACDPGEDFTNCSRDCDPVCGDGACQGLETQASCGFDCLATCGNHVCDELEDRENCGGDCGYCGDGTCQDGFETSSLNPAGNLETCVSDCVVSGCRIAADCDDGIACTENKCIADKCVYTPKDDLCAGNGKCIAFNGCCADADRDGYAAVACGGSDCNDQDNTTHPGAVELCGGGDKNCNGTHAPRLTPAKRLTNTPSAKRYLRVMPTGSGFILGWTGRPTNRDNFEFVSVTNALAVGTVQTVEEIELNATAKVAMAYNAGKNAIGVMWPDRDALGSNAAWVTLDGAVLGAPADLGLQCGGSYTEVAGDAIAQGSDVLFPSGVVHAVVTSGAIYNLAWKALGVAGGLATRWQLPSVCSETSATSAQLLKLDGLISGLAVGYPSEAPGGGTIVTFDPLSNDAPTAATLQHPSASGACALGEDGDLLVLVCSDTQKTWYHRATQGGSVFYSAEVQSGAFTPLGVGRSGGSSPKVGVAVKDGANNLWFFQRNQEGEAILEPAIIAGGGAISSAHVVHDGTDFLVLWLALNGGIEQVFSQRITCE